MSTETKAPSVLYRTRYALLLAALVVLGGVGYIASLKGSSTSRYNQTSPEAEQRMLEAFQRSETCPTTPVPNKFTVKK